MSLRTAAERVLFRWPRRIGGGIAGLRPTRQQRASGVWLRDRSSRPHRQPRRTSAELEARICAVRQATGWGPRLVAGATGQSHATVWRVLFAPRHLSPAAQRARGAEPLRVALPGRSAAHGRLHLPALPPARAPRHRRPLPARPALDAPRDTRRQRLRARDRRRPHPPGLRRAPRRRTRRHRHRLFRARAGVLRRPRHHRPPAS